MLFYPPGIFQLYWSSQFKFGRPIDLERIEKDLFIIFIDLLIIHHINPKSFKMIS